MSEALKNIVNDLLESSSHFNNNDVLVNVDENDKNLFFTSELRVNLDEFPKRILKTQKKTAKETGVNSLCLATDFVRFQMKSSSVNCPIFLRPLGFTIDKVKGEISFEPNIESVFLNPFFLQYIKSELEINENLPNATDRQEVLTWIKSLGLEINEEYPNVIGNFHHHRFQIVKELEEIVQEKEFANGLESLLLSEQPRDLNIDFPDDVILSSDTDHNMVYEKFKKSNLVIQGPPGTGKSQVLVNLIVKALSANCTSIVVSEKRVALEVLVKKLRDFNLDRFCFIASSDRLSSSFLKELKATWDYFDNNQFSPINNLRLSEQYLDNLQMTLDLLSQKELIGGVSFHQFQSMAKGVEINQRYFDSEISSLSDYIENENTLKTIYEKELFQLLGKLKTTTINDQEFNLFDQKITAWISEIIELRKQLDFLTWSDFDLLKKEAAVCQVFENDVYKKYPTIFKPNSSVQRKFLSLRKKFLRTTVELENFQKHTSQWKVKLSQQEAKSLLNRIENQSFLSKFKLIKRWKEVSNIPYREAKEELAGWLDFMQLELNYSKIKVDFCDLGIESPEIQIPLVYQTLHGNSESDWNSIASFSKEKRDFYTSSHKTLSRLHDELKRSFNFNFQDDVLQYLSALKVDFGQILLLKDEFAKLDYKTLNGLSRNESLKEFKRELICSHALKFKQQFPSFSEFKIEDIKGKINEVISAQKSEAILFSKSIENNIYSTFTEYHNLLTTPARKLTDELKAKKTRLRKGKSILIKEFSKTRSHPSLRELYNSEAKEWIQLLKPIWLSNPTQLAKCFPMEKELFDVAIFDEASQIPLQNALGTIQRSKRIVVAGDEHQMGPTNYFSTGASDQMDLLHQANYNWTKVNLKHHYRSLHPDLISFSNKHFYKNELKTFPSVDDSIPLNYYYCRDSSFVDRRNVNEAKQIATQIEKHIKSAETIGVVAFSEEQLQCIWEQLSESGQIALSERLEKDLGFFKALENVQGDECDHLLISFGYGKNNEGEFHMRFGPMNQSNGRRRLNVLLTRARKSLHFYSSVKSSEFKMSENESINLLKKWLQFIEGFEHNKDEPFPFGLTPTVTGNRLEFEEIQKHLPLAEEIVTLQGVLESRGWIVEYS